MCRGVTAAPWLLAAEARLRAWAQQTAGRPVRQIRPRSTQQHAFLEQVEEVLLILLCTDLGARLGQQCLPVCGVYSVAAWTTAENG